MLPHNTADCLIEILTEELPPKSSLQLAKDFCELIETSLNKEAFTFDSTHIFSTPRRLAILIKKLTSQSKDSLSERKGPSKKTAVDEKGSPTPAAIGFAKSCGLTYEALSKLQTSESEWLVFKKTIPGQSINQALPILVQQALLVLPIKKRMRWGEGSQPFVRPIHAIFIMYNQLNLHADVFGYPTCDLLYGHRFHAPAAIKLTSESEYETVLAEHYVIVSFEKRREKIRLSAEKIANPNHVLMDTSLLNEVTGLVEWPSALLGSFDVDFLNLPSSVLITAMQNHQRYFPILDKNNQLLPQFVVISNIKSRDEQHTIHGYERVLRARLKDADFFYREDQKLSLEERLTPLKGVVFQEKLGSLFDKAERISTLSAHIASVSKINDKQAARAALLCKTDLTTSMVNEFPELQGIMGGQYARLNGELPEIAQAIEEHYYPRFAGDILPAHEMGKIIGIADRIDSLVGTIGMNRLPTGDKDPYGLRRTALGLLRILIEQKIDLDLEDMLKFSAASYASLLINKTVVQAVFDFIRERLRHWYLEQGITNDIFMSVIARESTHFQDINQRIQAVQQFMRLNEAKELSAANKRISHLLNQQKQAMTASTINPLYFENDAERDLAEQLKIKSSIVLKLYAKKQYDQILLQLAELNQPINHFFDQVMVMTDDPLKRENRLLLLAQLRELFLQVADIALLQG
ncbi:MAG: glycine--tRNA ligase subunit beta [Gammaproteobacteria bacterium RIFCSPHIGHO2_12_FULL_42_10]|nr:MAG: glycine--tRNA ligase subunit beta [Gammaproteobacteria bacterium RIFCSPHIGHO2_12_FULL_42_10]